LAKRREDINKFTLIETHKRYHKPADKPKPSPYRSYTPACGCGRDAEWEVYDTLQPHCTACKDEALTSIPKPFVRELGGFDDAS
jgi:hypothetical protein